MDPPALDDDEPLSADVECLKWQAYLALRRLSNIRIRTDISPAGALDARLPNLLVSETSLLAAHLIPQWADEQTTADTDPLEGYKDEAARDESRAWVSLLEGTVHAALLAAAPAPSYLQSLFSLRPPPPSPIQSILTPPPPPLTGFASLLPPSGIRVPHATIFAQYREAIAALSDRLGTDKWFLGSSEPTPLDALAFAYLHCIILSSNSTLRVEVTRRVNLVAWEWRIRELVRAAFVTQ
ncbi:putative glutathione S-transferase, C-terminal domain [Lyophyllum shimeji]|uniref:Glutathione S-transferase, C-terminal domain n=1 Tax=Lyophyllum shimeji TaxID=47721 RepID=A0A9P3UKV0_LYOSH|nr:putative glutathione S-transferase, C-terminal domain [Lyophyllum shimeji]